MRPVFFCLFILTQLKLNAQNTDNNFNTKWYKGNIHVHTNISDGKSSLDSVIKWYINHDYNFLAITDHNKFSFSDSLNSIYNTKDKFILIPGVEITDKYEKRPVHLNGIGVIKNVLPAGGNSVENVIDNNLKKINEEKGFGVLNHPNGLLKAVITPEQIFNSSLLTHFEVCCADFKGGSGHISTDQIWDIVLSKNKLLYGVAADDAHDFSPYSKDPGSAWIMVKSEKLEQKFIHQAILKGQFYATTGVIVKNYIQLNNIFKVDLNADGYGYKTFFIGRNGRVLKTDETDSPFYKCRKKDKYVRVKIERSDGAIAWFQPVFYKALSKRDFKNRRI